MRKVNNAANELRKQWGLGNDPLFNAVELLEDHNLKVVKFEADLAFDGLQTWVNGSIPVIAYNSRNLNKSDRIKFTLLHELAHLLPGNNFGNISEKQKESLCHQFAGAMLLPEKAIRMELGDHRNRILINGLASIKKQYGISTQAIVMRARDGGIINEHYTRQFFFMIKQIGWKVDELIDYEGAEESHRFEQLIFRALAEEQISVSKAAALKNMTLAEFHNEYLLV